MNKIIIITIVSGLVTLVACKKKDDAATPGTAETAPTSTVLTGAALQKYLEQEEFVFEGVAPTGKTNPNYGNTIKFAAGKAVWGMRGAQFEAPYAVQGEKVNISASGGEGGFDCRLNEKSTSLIFRTELVCSDSGGIYYIQSSRRNEGESIKIGNESAVSTGYARGKLTTPAILRSEPSTTGAPISCLGGGSPLKDEFSIIARSINMVSVGKWKNYWYFVKTDDSYVDGQCSNISGWVFGEFVKKEK